MRQAIRAAASAAIAMALSGCYESKTALIARSDFPLPASLRFTLFELQSDGKTYKESNRGKIAREGDHYAQIADDHPEHTNRFKLKAIGGGLYVAQLTTEEPELFIYDLLKIERDTVYEYMLTCENGDKRFADQGLLERFVPDNVNSKCVVADFDKLARIFRQNALRPAPSKFAIQR